MDKILSDTYFDRSKPIEPKRDESFEMNLNGSHHFLVSGLIHHIHHVDQLMEMRDILNDTALLRFNSSNTLPKRNVNINGSNEDTESNMRNRKKLKGLFLGNPKYSLK